MLADNLTQPHSIKVAARMAGMSHFHFIRQFQALFGNTPHQFRIEQRLHLAKRLLATRELSVTETCLEIRMSSLGSFCTLFQDRVGLTPATFQRRARAMVQIPGQVPVELFPGCLSLMSMLPPEAFRRSNSAIFEKPNRITHP